MPLGHLPESGVGDPVTPVLVHVQARLMPAFRRFGVTALLHALVRSTDQEARKRVQLGDHQQAARPQRTERRSERLPGVGQVVH